jgi:2-polyprenyl-3-methyl-5-hydroxy-6-metoxy-1,4-benzoquinol methylase
MSHFDKHAKQWDDDPKKLERSQYFAKQIQKHLKNNQGKALEFGCGTGLLSFELKDNFNHIFLTDESKGMIEVLKNKISASNVDHFDALEIDLLEESFDFPPLDAIYTLMTLHHIKDLNSIFETFNQLLANSGQLFIIDLVSEDGSFHSNHPGFDGHLGFDKNELSEQLKKQGFTVLNYDASYSIVKNEKEYPVFILLAEKQ